MRWSSPRSCGVDQVHLAPFAPTSPCLGVLRSCLDESTTRRGPPVLAAALRLFLLYSCGFGRRYGWFLCGTGLDGQVWQGWQAARTESRDGLGQGVDGAVSVGAAPGDEEAHGCRAVPFRRKPYLLLPAAKGPQLVHAAQAVPLHNRSAAIVGVGVNIQAFALPVVVFGMPWFELEAVEAKVGFPLLVDLPLQSQVVILP
jgi:hypothetical protein